uniref:Rop family plasmid primer RNA-binding protein n=1 Tax=Rodentolepis nana TaxID=102285 RepID=A0A0R3T7M8_RODNA
LPIKKVPVSAESIKLIAEMYDRIRDAIDCVDNFYDNCEVTE